MTILHSCCCWHSVRKGSYASAAYTFVYFTITGSMLAAFLHKEREYLTGEIATPESYSFLEEEISKATIVLHMVLVVLSTLGVLSAILLAIGIYKDVRALLLPWIYIILTDIIVELAHFIYLTVQEVVDFHPITGVLYTADFFLLCLNIYSLLCVISQYQEYKAGRGTASDDFDQSIPSLRLQYLSHHNATRNANQASRSVFSNNNAAETQLHPTERRTSCIKVSQDNKTGTGNSVSVIGDQLQTNGQSRNNNTIPPHRSSASKMRKVKFPDEKLTVSSEPSSIDMDLHVETVCVNTSEPSWNSSQHLQRADREPLLRRSPDDHKVIQDK